jgi:hypothetical protein
MDDGRPGGEGPSYIALLRWFWSFVGIKGQIGGSALQDGRYFLDAMVIGTMLLLPLPLLLLLPPPPPLPLLPPPLLPPPLLLPPPPPPPLQRRRCCCCCCCCCCCTAAHTV